MTGILRIVELEDASALPILEGLRLEYDRRYGASGGELSAHADADFGPPDGVFLVVEERGRTVAGGGLRRWDADTAEIKRMWTAPAHRRRGHARAVLRALERSARKRGYASVRLQSGTEQPEALALYEQEGFARIAAYGPYRDDPRCVCLEKRL